jgi:hypothetical protein
LVLALVLSLLVALAYQVASRRFGWRVVAYWLLALAAILGGEALAESLGWNLMRLGDLRLGPDLAMAALVIGVLWLLGI